MEKVPEPVTLPALGLAALWFGAFLAALFLGSRFLPGPVREGAPQPDGSRQRYRLNGLILFALLLAFVAAGTGLGVVSLVWLCRRFWSLFVVANVFAVVLTLLLCARGRRAGSDGRGVLRDLFLGTELNPTWQGVDLKMFSYRPSLMGLGLFALSFAAVQHVRHGSLTGRMILYEVFVLAYLANYFQFEYGMLYTWDVIAERFGGMLIWGDYVLVPFFYSIAGWFLIDKEEPLGPAPAAGLVVLYLAGFCLFRGANQQKHCFKTDPAGRIWGRPAEALGGKLLVSGFWGIGRKLNYTGELCLYCAWTLLCGFDSWLPYLLPLGLALLLGHRAWRDERRCQAMYGALWTAYCARARFRMIPFLY